MPTFVVGDIHGHPDELRSVLRGAGLLDRGDRWAAADAALWFLGDFFDRGPDGIGAVDLVRRLQNEAPAAGGRVGALLGNHEVLILGAHLLGPEPTTGPGGTFLEDWLINGGVRSDLDRLSAERVAWVTSLPALARVEGHLLLHADSMLYNRYGSSVEAVIQSVAQVLRAGGAAEFDRLLEEFSERDAFLDAEAGGRRAAEVLGRFGGRRLVHGHTPIARVTGQQPWEVEAALVYGGGRCVNADPGFFLGGAGFVYRLEEA